MSFFEAAGAIVKIDSSLKSNHLNQVQLVPMLDNTFIIFSYSSISSKCDWLIDCWSRFLAFLLSQQWLKTYSTRSLAKSFRDKRKTVFFQRKILKKLFYPLNTISCRQSYERNSVFKSLEFIGCALSQFVLN